jgi:hypothetical protein
VLRSLAHRDDEVAHGPAVAAGTSSDHMRFDADP